MLLDANILLYAVNRQSDRHELAAEWLSSVLHSRRRVGIPWQCIGAFLRISTHPRVNLVPLTTTKAWEYVNRWLECDTVWIPPATENGTINAGIERQNADLFRRLAAAAYWMFGVIAAGHLATISIVIAVVD